MHDPLRSASALRPGLFTLRRRQRALLRLVRNGTSFTGLYSLDGVTWTVVGTATVPSATGAEDAGVFMT